MVKEQQEIVEPKKSLGIIKKLKRGIKIVIFAAIIGGIGCGLWKNPQIIEKTRSLFEPKVQIQEEVIQQPSPEALLREEVNTLKLQVNNLQKQVLEQQDTSVLEEKFANLEKSNLNIIDSKADVATILGVITRMDKAEQKLDTLAKVTDESALILTTTMLVKESADRGGSFEYEAEMLQQIAANNLKLKEPIEVIIKSSTTGVDTTQYLQKEFESVYTKLLELQKMEFEKTWKDRLNSKISEYIKVKKVNEKDPEFKANQELEIVKKAVDSGNIKKAITNLENIKNKELLNEDSLKNWMAEAQAKVEFVNAINKISAYYLASMKINFIKKETHND